MEEKKKKDIKKERLKPISLYPLDVEEALGDILGIKPKEKTGDSVLNKEDST